MKNKKRKKEFLESSSDNIDKKLILYYCFISYGRNQIRTTLAIKVGCKNIYGFLGEIAAWLAAENSIDK